ncbi:tol-pal system protein YbgF [Rhodovibrio salinarum]|uniref:Cell division coordinator CpoB n=1 Tax=Rhodovibrio salinarum TaxID=1087 RepID=A0A934QID1_9PROT|nr:tol-pal system protein YbgF [Rhodovibrio salinarum]MBK1697327.1 tol-pal system protein YbgF [Rhodovibrio salinarum]
MTAFPTSPICCSKAPRLLLTALVTGFLVWSVPAPQAHAQSGVERLTNKVDRLQRELNDLQRQVYSGEGGGTAPAASSAPTSGSGGGMTQTAAARLQQKLSQLERAVQDLTGRLERVQYDLRQLTQRMDTRAKDVDYRLSQLEQAAGVSATGGGQQTGQGAQTGQGPGQTSRSGGDQGGRQAQDLRPDRQGNQRQGTQQGQASQRAQSGQNGQNGQGQGGDTLGQVSQRAVDELRQNRDNQQTGSGQQGQSQQAETQGRGQGQQTAAAEVELPDGSPQEQYDYAFGLLRQADYAQAEQALTKFLNQHPEHTLAGNAQYWLGETFYVRGNYERAAVTFAEGFQTYPDSQKAPDNLLKLGMSLAQIDRTEDACGIFAELQSRYPDAKQNILQRAQREQSRLSCGQG